MQWLLTGLLHHITKHDANAERGIEMRILSGSLVDIWIITIGDHFK